MDETTDDDDDGGGSYHSPFYDFDDLKKWRAFYLCLDLVEQTDIGKLLDNSEYSMGAC